MFKHKLLMDQTQGQESSGSAAQSTQATTTTNTTQAQGQSTGTIEQMYGETQTTQQTQATQTQQATKTEAGKEGTASGYEAPPAGTGSGYTDPTKDQQQQQTTETTQSKTEFDETGLSPEAIKEIKDFAAANKLSKEATEQYAKVIKGQAGLIENFQNTINLSKISEKLTLTTEQILPPINQKSRSSITKNSQFFMNSFQRKTPARRAGKGHRTRKRPSA